MFLLLMDTVFGYFTANTNGSGVTAVNINTTEGAKLKFIPGDELIIDANMDNLSINGNNLSAISKPQVTLESEDTYADTYSAYFKINKNDFVYTSETEEAELMLTVKRPDGTFVDTIEDLEYTTSNGVQGFDVTGLYENYEDLTISNFFPVAQTGQVSFSYYGYKDGWAKDTYGGYTFNYDSTTGIFKVSAGSYNVPIKLYIVISDSLNIKE